MLFDEIIDEMLDIMPINPENIPDIPLYMDQVTTFIDDKLKALKRDEKDKLLTKTMINNYTKDGLLFPPVKKKYSKTHIALLFMIYYLKEILPISDVKEIVSEISKTEKIMEYFENFVQIQASELQLFAQEMKNDADLADSEMLILKLTVRMNLYKQLIEKVIDNNLMLRQSQEKS